MDSLDIFPLEIWVHIASFSARAAVPLLFVVRGLAEFLKRNPALLARNARLIYGYNGYTLYAVERIEGAPDRKWPKHGDYYLYEPGANGPELVARYERNQMIWSPYRTRKTRGGFYVGEIGFIPVGDSRIRHGYLTRVSGTADKPKIIGCTPDNSAYNEDVELRVGLFGWRLTVHTQRWRYEIRRNGVEMSRQMGPVSVAFYGFSCAVRIPKVSESLGFDVLDFKVRGRTLRAWGEGNCYLSAREHSVFIRAEDEFIHASLRGKGVVVFARFGNFCEYVRFHGTKCTEYFRYWQLGSEHSIEHKFPGTEYRSYESERSARSFEEPGFVAEIERQKNHEGEGVRIADIVCVNSRVRGTISLYYDLAFIDGRLVSRNGRH